MGNNDKLPVSEVESFSAKALSVGAYQRPQEANQSAALKIVVEHERKTNPKVDAMPVGELLEKVDAILDDYGGQTSASPASITTYKWRAKKVLNDFIERHNGDFMKWKTELARKGAATKATKKPKVREVEQPPAASPPSETSKLDDAQANEQTHRLKLPGGKVGRLILPDPISKRELDVAWKLLAAYRTLLETEAGIDDGDDTAGVESEGGTTSSA